MPWREALLVRFGTGAFSGMTLGRWLKVLAENRFSVDFPYWGRAAAITFNSIPNTPLSWWENLRYGRKVRDTKVHPPLFVLGIWRSGTTHLHYLLAKDDRFAYPNNYQVFFPRTFLTTERLNGKLVGAFWPQRRPQDNMSMKIHEPQEDEFALCSLIGKNCVMSWTFPRRAGHYDRYLTLRDLSANELAAWKSALALFVRKLSFKYGRPLVLKSPGHTCRIKVLLETFPDARFVHIRRNPYEVFQSARHTARTVRPWWALQRPDHTNLEERTLEQYKEVYDAFFDERDLIPQGRFHEISYESLETDPLGTLRGVYEALSLPDFQYVEPALRQYTESLVGYKKNKFSELDPDLKQRIARHCRRSFDAWGYPM